MSIFNYYNLRDAAYAAFIISAAALDVVALATFLGPPYFLTTAAISILLAPAAMPLAVAAFAISCFVNLALVFVPKSYRGPKPELCYDYETDEIKNQLDTFYKRLNREYLRIRPTLSDSVRKAADGVIYPFKDLHDNRHAHLRSFYWARRTFNTWFSIKRTTISGLLNLLGLGFNGPIVTKKTSFHVEMYRRTMNERDSHGIQRSPILIKDYITGIQRQLCEKLTWAMDNNKLKQVLEGLADSICFSTIMDSLDNVVGKISSNQFKFADLLNKALDQYANVYAANQNKNKWFGIAANVQYTNFNEMAAQIGDKPELYRLTPELISFLYNVIDEDKRNNLLPTPHGSELEQSYSKANIKQYLINNFGFEEAGQQKPLLFLDQLEQGLSDIWNKEAPSIYRPKPNLSFM